MVSKGGEIFVIGAGSMSEAFIRGITKGGVVPPEQIRVLNKSRRDKLEQLTAGYGVRQATSFSDIQHADIVALAVKPADVSQALSSALPFLDGQLLISFAAGVGLAQLERDSEGKAAAIRTMPNLPVSVSAGTTAVAFSEDVGREERTVVLRLLEQLGDAVEMPEDMMDAVTALSGSGPGFLCYMLEAIEDAAVSVGFTPELARRMLLTTLTGTVRTLDEWELSPRELRLRVMSPGGTTAAGVDVLEKNQVRQSIGKAILAAAQRSEELGRTYAKR
ncbi:pyrroline-5-carboxylate reductase [Alicyclobacillus sp. SO9]|uniref:pyrroline-5-carboxylate reductase n=1 Tax=Alicyclobacillus sp. SO9 TaxID=2665646 RepID=UPI0018E8164B|nr:pyrroline-5-carboxylate reductase [Alicyclobacillus sp. SO9]QQE79362.1 pyrroline-5-carboxylate reductase [Alicyclobacillus sp. SO9]